MGRRWLIVGVLAALVGCSSGIMYRQLDWILPWYVDDYLSLDSAQEQALDRRVLDLLKWHCTTQLPRYVSWLRQLAAEADTLTADDALHRYHQLIAFWQVILVQLGPEASRLLAPLDEEQLAELFENLEEKNRDDLDDFVGPPLDEQVEKRIDSTVDSLERWIGDLTPAQSDLLESWARQLGPIDPAWIENRRRWQIEFRRLLAERQEQPHFSQRLTSLMLSPEQTWDAGYYARYLERRDQTVAMLVRLFGSLDAEQRNHLREAALELADEFATTSCSRPSSEFD